MDSIKSREKHLSSRSCEDCKRLLQCYPHLMDKSKQFYNQEEVDRDRFKANAFNCAAYGRAPLEQNKIAQEEN
jgi:hypothetical protein